MRAPERGALPLWLATTLGRTYGRLTETVQGLSDADFARPTRCAGMAVGPLLVHLLYDAQRALVAFASPSTAEPDRDFVSYWNDFPPLAGEDPESATSFVRTVASAYRMPAELVGHWREVSEAAVRAAAFALVDKGRRVETQGHVLRAPDFVATLVFEATVHHLDLILELPDAPEPDPEGLQVTARTLDGLFGPEAWDVIAWDTTTYVLKATGRVPLTAQDLDMLGPHADRLPLIG
ncbi:MAG TPA: maleylpyruvate isomerase N-terminal domain-containing protein [Kribbella sp.]|uniref:maleylpyruvate isomerase N-terminal domain-containing protein n=1 Tax=Kribbella sp. TaxID=1871183 RepID=UPI002D76A0A4|nr:maleylpyruvate isomerase N-terminal domain-containing protein [Kribbella sp.]HET6294574.1 maleylpyruvate isomerase N-terminal domain-containing protein [Kribbella sp.]